MQGKPGVINLLATLTFLDVLDDAVKIGLGAAIGGFFAGRLAQQKYSHDVAKEDRRHSQEIAKEDRAHRRKALELLASEFEQVHGDIWGERRPSIDEVNLAVRKLHGIEGELMLFKLNDCAAVVDKYRLEVSKVATAPLSDSNFEAWAAERRNSAAAKRVEFFKLMAAAYS